MKVYEGCFGKEGYGWDAIDCLFAFGYDIKKAAKSGYEYKLALWSKAVTSKEQNSIDLLLVELEENSAYYTRRIIEIGKALL